MSTLPSSKNEPDPKKQFSIESLRNAILSLESGDAETALELIDGTRKHLMGLTFEKNFPGTHTVIEGEDFKITFPKR